MGAAGVPLPPRSAAGGFLGRFLSRTLDLPKDMIIIPSVLLVRGRHLEASGDGAGRGARGRETNAPPKLPSGAGAPPGDNRIPCQELADDAEPSGSFGSAARRRSRRRMERRGAQTPFAEGCAAPQSVNSFGRHAALHPLVREGIRKGGLAPGPHKEQGRRSFGFRSLACLGPHPEERPQAASRRMAKTRGLMVRDAPLTRRSSP